MAIVLIQLKMIKLSRIHSDLVPPVSVMARLDKIKYFCEEEIKEHVNRKQFTAKYHREFIGAIQPGVHRKRFPGEPDQT